MRILYFRSSANNMSTIDVTTVLQGINIEDLFTEFDVDIQPEPNTQRNETMTEEECAQHTLDILKNVTKDFCFGEAAQTLIADEAKVSQFSKKVLSTLSPCVILKSNVKGVNREASQAAFFKLMTGGVPELTAESGDYRLTIWVCNNIFEAFITRSVSISSPSCDLSSTRRLSPEEADITHYIGGFVCSKLKQRIKTPECKQILETLISSEAPEPDTLCAAKSRGMLTNLTKDGQFIFIELEQIFCTLFPPTVTCADVKTYTGACIENDIIQNCFHNATDHLDTIYKDRILKNIITLYFKVRVHQKCKVLVEKVRSKKHASKQEKALRSKLAK